jgi:hypothetical protein
MSLPNELLPVGLLAGGAGTTQYRISRSLRFNSADSAYLSRTPSVAGNRKTWTWAGWVKRSVLGVTQTFFSNCDINSANGFFAAFLSTDCIELGDFSSVYVSRRTTTQVFRDTGSWYHLVVQYDTTNATGASRIRLFVNGAEVVSFSSSLDPAQNYDGYIGNTQPLALGRTGSFNGTYLSGYLADIHFIDGQALTPSSFGEFDTNGVWQPKTYTGTYGTNGFHLDFADNSAATAAALGKDTSGNGNNWTPNNLSVQSFAPERWVWTGTGGVSGLANAFDSNLATYASCVTAGNGQDESIYLNIDTSNSPIVVGSGQTLDIYTYQGFGNGVRKIRVNGGAYVLDDSSGKCSFTGPLTITSIRSTLGPNAGNGYTAIISGFVLNGVTITNTGSAGNDSLVDTPTNYGTDTGAGGEVRGNYATLNPLANGSPVTLSNGNLDFSITANQSTTLATTGMSTGKWYWEILISTLGASSHGISNSNITLSSDYTGKTPGSYGYFGADGRVYNNNSGSTAYATYGNGDIIGVAYDADNGKLYFSKNGTFINSGNPVSGTGPVATGLSGTYFPTVSGGLAGACSGSINFGQRPFAYAAPSGFKALCTQNLTSTTIPNGRTAMDVVTYTGNGSTQTISGLGFGPDLVWVKNRSSSYVGVIADSVRGDNVLLSPGGTFDESTFDATWRSNWGTINTFSSSSVNVVSGSQADGNINNSSKSYVAWAWDAGTTTVTNTSGSITSQVRANASAGISVVSWTGNITNGATVGHGLNAIPYVTIYKNRNNTYYTWIVNTTPITGTGNYLILNGTNPLSSNAQYTLPTSSVLTLPSYSGTNDGNMIAYCFAPVAGFSAFGSYTGNGSADGPFIFANHSPRFIMIKRTDTTGNWYIWDTARDTFNAATKELYPNLANAEGTATDLDILSNGFKIRNTTADFNANNGTYIYCSFASNPFANTRAR